MEVWETFANALARSDGQPQASFAALASLADELVGVRLFTLMTFDHATRQARRIYSNMPDVYPVLGTKEIEENRWTAAVLDAHETFVANDIESIAQVFNDHEQIRQLGCESVINVPIVVGGRTLGTINCLHRARWYTPQRVAASRALKLPGAACFLICENNPLQGDR